MFNVVEVARHRRVNTIDGYDRRDPEEQKFVGPWVQARPRP
jgi:hypothetical protein